MKLAQLLELARNKTNFSTIDDYSSFCEKYLSFVYDGLQAVIVSQNETQYRFYQYKKDGSYNVTRPINSALMISVEQFAAAKNNFMYAMKHIKEIKKETEERNNLNKFVYTCQQSIGGGGARCIARRRKQHGAENKR